MNVKFESKCPFSPASPPAQMAKLYFIAFPKSYLTESVFSQVTMLSKVTSTSEGSHKKKKKLRNTDLNDVALVRTYGRMTM
jgi:hypothetical protein